MALARRSSSVLKTFSSSTQFHPLYLHRQIQIYQQQVPSATRNYSSTMSSPEEASDAKFWDKTSAKYAKSAISDMAGYQRSLDRTLKLLSPTDSVLELGCGTGTTALHLASSARSYLATDISPKMIEIAKQKAAADDNKNKSNEGLAFRVATAEALVAETGRFDAVLGFNYIHLTQDVPGTLKTIHALLKPGGLFVSKTPCLGDMNFLVRWALLPAMRTVGLAPTVHSFSGAELGQKIEENGFEVVATEFHATKKSDTRPYIVARKR